MPTIVIKIDGKLDKKLTQQLGCLEEFLYLNRKFNLVDNLVVVLLVDCVV